MDPGTLRDTYFKTLGRTHQKLFHKVGQVHNRFVLFHASNRTSRFILPAEPMASAARSELGDYCNCADSPDDSNRVLIEYLDGL
jgi:hypothetical protein